MPIVLDQANVYYEINIDVKNSTYNLKTYSIADAVDPIPHTYGSISLTHGVTVVRGYRNSISDI